MREIQRMSGGFQLCASVLPLQREFRQRKTGLMIFAPIVESVIDETDVHTARDELSRLISR